MITICHHPAPASLRPLLLCFVGNLRSKLCENSGCVLVILSSSACKINFLTQDSLKVLKSHSLEFFLKCHKLVNLMFLLEGTELSCSILPRLLSIIYGLGTRQVTAGAGHYYQENPKFKFKIHM